MSLAEAQIHLRPWQAWRDAKWYVREQIRLAKIEAAELRKAVR